MNPLLNKIETELYELFNNTNGEYEENDMAFKVGEVRGMLRALRTIGIKYNVILKEATK